MSPWVPNSMSPCCRACTWLQLAPIQYASQLRTSLWTMCHVDLCLKPGSPKAPKATGECRPKSNKPQRDAKVWPVGSGGVNQHWAFIRLNWSWISILPGTKLRSPGPYMATEAIPGTKNSANPAPPELPFLCQAADAGSPLSSVQTRWRQKKGQRTNQTNAHLRACAWHTCVE